MTNVGGPTKRNRSGLRIGCIAAIVLVLLVCSVCLVGLVLNTPLNRPLVGLGLPNPDSAYITGSAFGYTLYSWNCYSGKHIVIYNSSSEMLASSYQREEVPCGEQTPIEKKTANEQFKRELPTNSFW